MSAPAQTNTHSPPCADAFTHLPGLRGRVRPAEQSAVRITPEVLALWDRRAQAAGQPADWRLSDQQLEASRRALLDAGPAPGDLWVFGYGSLMWDPGIHFAEVRRADLPGHERRFNYRVILGRGTPQQPALMLSLEPAAGCCCGLAFRIAADQVEAESAMLWRREMIRGGYCPVLRPVATPQGPVNALVFASNPAHPGYAGDLPLAEAAAIIARAAGVIGSNRDYLEQLAAQLAALQIDDPYVDRLLARVRALG
jgi:cation transport protein ChaC